MRKTALFAALALSLTSCASDAPTEPGLMPHGAHLSQGGGQDHSSAAVNQLLAELRKATQKYHSLAAAEADGFVQLSPCVPGMGYHYGRIDRIDDVHNALEPEVLVYAPNAGGQLKLVAVEYLATGSTRPAFAGEVEFEDFHEVPGVHYALHAWVWKGNPEGIFHAANPQVSCPS